MAVASPAYLLAMKILAARAAKDSGDISFLYGLCGYSTVVEGIALLERLRPDRPIPVESVALLEELFGPLASPSDG